MQPKFSFSPICKSVSPIKLSLSNPLVTFKSVGESYLRSVTLLGENISAAMSHNIPHKISAAVSHNMSNNMSHTISTAMSHNMSQNIYHTISAAMSHNMSHNISAAMSHNMSHTISHNISAAVSHLTRAPSPTCPARFCFCCQISPGYNCVNNFDCFNNHLATKRIIDETIKIVHMLFHYIQMFSLGFSSNPRF